MKWSEERQPAQYPSWPDAVVALVCWCGHRIGIEAGERGRAGLARARGRMRRHQEEKHDSDRVRGTDA